MSDSTTADIEKLAEQLAGEDPAGRLEAAERLCRAGMDAAAAAVPLVRACGDDDDQVREWAVAALEELGPPPPASIPQLAELAADRHPLVAYWAMTLLGRSGQAAATAVTVLARGLGSANDPSVRQRAAWALGKVGIGAVAAREALEKAATDADPRLARMAREALDSIGL
jgi:HEAT repeat protein